ncbi:MAG: adenylosuccinate lyase [Clostridia bacterium]|nr:adenylosuccinate lyase [Clostridia bacterium]MBR7032122.1 adenylosuccinate lyase [Clostridia bacterium]
MSNKEFYESPLCSRYAGDEMKRIFSPDRKFSTWRKLWVALAEAEMELGIPITKEQVEELRENIFNIDYDAAARYEKEVRHDVMAHVKAYGDVCPNAAGIIHLGATSCYVGDNTDLILMREALLEIRKLLVTAIRAAAEFARENADVPTLAYTHFQAAQPTTVGKRAVLWIQDLVSDLSSLEFRLDGLRLLGCKGTTGTGASFLKLFEGDHEKVKKLDSLIAEKMNFPGCYPVSCQTYSRKVDFDVLSVLAGIAQSAAKFSNDIRLLSHLKEFDEPFEKGQIGSSAMAYKRNPMRSERIMSLARYVMTDLLNPAFTAASQWFERTLDDSANKRISVPEAFLATDAILRLMTNVISGGSVYPGVMKRHLDEEIPFIATENVLMYCTKNGGNRQELHEAIREHSVACAKEIKLNGAGNDLLDRIAGDPRFGITREELDRLCDVRSFVGRAPEQTREYLSEVVDPLLEKYGGEQTEEIEINV